MTGAAQDRAGNLYVSELFKSQLVLVPRSGPRATLAVPFPAGVVTDRKDNVYVSAYSLSPVPGPVHPTPTGRCGG